MANTVQTVGGFTAVFNHPLIVGSPIPLKGFKLEDTFIHTDQLLDNSKLIPLVDGGTCTITNAMIAGKLTINALRVSDNYLDGDLIVIANLLQALGDNVGGTLKLTYGFSVNGSANNSSITFTSVTVARCPPAIIAGNDLPVYPVILNYASYVRNA